MRISELSEASGVPVATLKYYLREGLLPPGESRGATRAEYAARHLERVRLLRALIESAGLSLADVRRVVASLDHPPATRHELLGVAQRALPAAHREHPVTPEVRALVAGLGWQVSPDAPALHTLSGAVAAARAGGIPLSADSLRRYAEAVEGVAVVDVATVRELEPERALLTVTVGTVLVDPVLAALRRLAQEGLSSRAT
ncbi:MAG TPA: MerR family transcriptional regulator [Pedococcus sp.]|jgi:DNA-binding transcriptional MerR regulator